MKAAGERAVEGHRGDETQGYAQDAAEHLEREGKEKMGDPK